MPKTYITISGDMWDMIALHELGSESLKDTLMRANKQHIYTYKFPAGVVLVIPDVPIPHEAGLPPWRTAEAVVLT